MLTRLNTLEDLSLGLPHILRVFDVIKVKSGMDMTKDEFFKAIIARFKPNSYYLIDLDEDGNLKFLAILFPVDYTENPGDILFWILWASPHASFLTESYVEGIRKTLKEDGFQTVLFETTRITKSFHRFVSKFGALKYKLIYKRGL